MSRARRRHRFSRRAHEQRERGRRHRGDEWDVCLVVCNGCGSTIDVGPLGEHSAADCAAQQTANAAGDVPAEAAA